MSKEMMRREKIEAWRSRVFGSIVKNWSRRAKPTPPPEPPKRMDRTEWSEDALKFIRPYMEERDGWVYYYAPTKVVYHGVAGARVATQQHEGVEPGDIQHPTVGTPYDWEPA